MSWRERLARWRRRDEDLVDEIASHLAMAAQDRVARGEAPDAARAAARREFGNVTRVREQTRLSWRGAWLDRLGSVLADVRYGARLLRGSPAFSLTVILVLGLGISANMVTFGLMTALTVRPLAGVADAGRLQFVGARMHGGAQTVPASYPDYQYVRDNDQSHVALAASAIQPLAADHGAEVERVWAEFVSGNYFDVLGVGAQRGRVLRPGDAIAPGQHPVAVLSAGYWRRMHGAAPDVVGRSLRLNGRVFTIVGIAADGFRGSVVGVSSDLFVPVVMGPSMLGFGDLEDPDERWLQVFGFPKPGVTLAEAQAEAEVLSTRLATERRDEGDSRRAFVVPLPQWPYGAQSYLLPGVSVLEAMSVLLMVAVCANVMGLVLVRGLARGSELATRLALGATRGRVRRLLLIENLLLAAPAVGIGLFLPRVAEPFLGGAAANLPFPLAFNFDGPLMTVFAIGVAVASTLVFGVAPGVRASRVDVIAVMKAGAVPRGPRAGLLRAGLVIVQVAAALLLLVGTSLVLRTLDAAQRTDPGFAARGVSWAAIDVRPAGYAAASARGFYARLVDALRRDEAIAAASVTELLPLTLIEWQSGGFVPEGVTRTPETDFGAAYNVVGAGYFDVMGIALAAGREFTERDTAAAPSVVFVNETFARRFWGSAADAVGRRIDDNGTWRTIVGVARDSKYVRLDEGRRSYVYSPASQRDELGLIVVVRGRAAHAAVLQRVRAIVHQIDPRAPVLDEGALADQLRVAVSIYDTIARILTAIGLIAVGLAALGVYGIVAYRARQSAHEIGIRTAIGATRADVVRLVLRQGLMLSGAGIALGVVVSIGAAGAMSSVLYGVSAVDAVSFVAAALLLLVVVLMASVPPAWRAACASPVTALRRT